MTDAALIKRKIKQFILSNFMQGEQEQNLQDDDLLFEGGIINSSGAMMLVEFIESHYSIQVLDDELFLENFASISKIVNFISKKLKNNNTSIKMNFN